MKSPQIPRGLRAVYTFDSVGLTCCALVDRDFKVVSAGISRYSPKDRNDPLHPYDVDFGKMIALGRAIKEYNKNHKDDDYLSADTREKIKKFLKNGENRYAPLPLKA